MLLLQLDHRSRFDAVEFGCCRCPDNVTCKVPCPFKFVWPVATGRKRHRPTHATVDGVKVLVDQPEACAVDGIKEVKDRKVKLTWQV